jgi:hypothetical protein
MSTWSVARSVDLARARIVCAGRGVTLAPAVGRGRPRGITAGSQAGSPGWTSFYGMNRFAGSSKDKTPGSESMQWYLRAIGRDKLLDREKEIILASRIRLLLDWENRRLQEEEMLDRKITMQEWADVVGARLRAYRARTCACSRARGQLCMPCLLRASGCGRPD